jgi:hypothetical protein
MAIAPSRTDIKTQITDMIKPEVVDAAALDILANIGIARLGELLKYNSVHFILQSKDGGPDSDWALSLIEGNI